MSKRQLHLNIGINSTGYFSNSWRHRQGNAGDFIDPAYYLRLARTAHRARFDALFLSDHPALMQDSADRPLHTLDPLILLTALAAQVPDIGLVATTSSSYNSPYNLARRAMSLDVLSGGRLALNIVSSFKEEVAANFGSAPLPSRPVRYARADAFLDVLKQLWGSWALPEGFTASETALWPADSAHAIKHHSEHFSVAGPLNVPRSAQGQPVIAQAGASRGGIALAAKHAEIVYCSLLSKPAAAHFSETVRGAAVAHGRRPADLRITPGVVPIVAESREAALRRHEILTDTGSEAGLLERFARAAGLDPATLDPDAVLSPTLFATEDNQRQPQGFTQGLIDLLTYEKLTARQVIRRQEQGHRLVLGSPQEVADQLIDWWQSGVVDGYTVQVPALPDDLDRFADQVVPILQARGVFRTEYEESTLRA
ncbi:NtaA/DmoA family FMN-dependent monooxygenase [Robbsia sp. KACC 23696]|uniref:NtaA/DmoA family FMN-dependent monooxygenase n=1 Tax=Robbsia sp. KACC 23696 TaxID=3149231 RepID=UPI00325BF092